MRYKKDSICADGWYHINHEDYDHLFLRMENNESIMIVNLGVAIGITYSDTDDFSYEAIESIYPSLSTLAKKAYKIETNWLLYKLPKEGFSIEHYRPEWANKPGAPFYSVKEVKNKVTNSEDHMITTKIVLHDIFYDHPKQSFDEDVYTIF